MLNAVACWEAVAADPTSGFVLVVTKNPDTFYVLHKDSSGKAVLTQITKVVQLDDVITPPPGPTDPTNPVEIHRKAVTEATNNVNDANKTNTKIALAKLYRTVASLPVTNRAQLLQSTDLLFKALNLPMAWEVWKISIDKSLENFSALDDAKRAWQVVAEVLEK